MCHSQFYHGSGVSPHGFPSPHGSPEDASREETPDHSPRDTAGASGFQRGSGSPAPDITTTLRDKEAPANFALSQRSKLLILLIIIISLATGVLATSYVEKRIQSTGSVFNLHLGIEVYSDPECTTVLSQVNWGAMTAGESASRTIYIKNTGNTQLQVNITTANWTPTDGPDHITLTSSINDFPLNPGSTQTVIITLTVSSNLQGDIDFRFEIVVGGNQ